ncbi:MAG: hypothetical protein GF421_07455 [Candidatus Aminicenantes bacterium]|nr:hypothetical protein [Candidatus Aminicenantes bacterium]
MRQLCGKLSFRSYPFQALHLSPTLSGSFGCTAIMKAEDNKEKQMSHQKKEETIIPEKGTVLSAEKGTKRVILDILKKALAENLFDAVLIPAQVPETEAYSWILLQDESLFEWADPLPPVMTVQGGRALSSFSKNGELEQNIAALLRPCEIRAAIELFKLKQVNLKNITLISLDCPGAMPLSNYMSDPQKTKKDFQHILEKWENSESLRPVCQVCQHFSFIDGTAADLHIGLLGDKNKNITLIPSSPKGKKLLDQLEFGTKDSVEKWKTEKQQLANEKIKRIDAFNREWKKKINQANGFFNEFNPCINCHNCMNVCPMCYCQQCYFDSQAINFKPEAYMQKAEQKGALRFPLNTMLFHIGRMSHMVLSCVSCGACEDACPVSIPVSQLFSMVSDQTQKEFKYTPGMNREDALPLQDFTEQEFCEVEVPDECHEKAPEEAK